jgi:hypothetical protein
MASLENIKEETNILITTNKELKDDNDVIKGRF